MAGSERSDGPGLCVPGLPFDQTGPPDVFRSSGTLTIGMILPESGQLTDSIPRILDYAPKPGYIRCFRGPWPLLGVWDLGGCRSVYQGFAGDN